MQFCSENGGCSKRAVGVVIARQSWVHINPSKAASESQKNLEKNVLKYCIITVAQSLSTILMTDHQGFRSKLFPGISELSCLKNREQKRTKKDKSALPEKGIELGLVAASFHL